MSSGVERLHEARAEIGEDIKAVMEEAKNAGFVPKIIRQVVRERRMEPGELQDHLTLLDTYRRGLGMLVGTPLGDAAMAKVESRAEKTTRRAINGAKPRPFADQTVGKRPRGRPKGATKGKDAGTAMADARAHLGEPAGTA
jgi:uncharacterized protein (UPF0335 family)